MRNKIIFFLIGIITFLNISNINSFADSNSLTFSLNIIKPENQYNKDVTYFDLLTKPNEKQKLQLKITNISDKKEVVEITPTNAITNSSGLVDYSVQKKEFQYDETLNTKFTSLVSGSQKIEVNPKETKTVSFDFTAPKEEFSGIILGGFVAKTVNEKNDNETNGKVSFVNKFQIVKAVVVRSSKNEIDPILKLNDVKPALYNYRTAVTANIQNTTPTLLKNVSVNAEITKKGTTKVLKSEKRDDIELAPNSNFNFPILWGNEPLDHGEYTINITTIANKKKFEFKKDFIISKEDSYKINSEAMDLNDNNTDSSLWIILIILLILVIILLILWILFKQKKLSLDNLNKLVNPKNKEHKKKEHKKKKHKKKKS